MTAWEIIAPVLPYFRTALVAAFVGDIVIGCVVLWLARREIARKR